MDEVKTFMEFLKCTYPPHDKISNYWNLLLRSDFGIYTWERGRFHATATSTTVIQEVLIIHDVLAGVADCRIWRTTFRPLSAHHRSPRGRKLTPCSTADPIVIRKIKTYLRTTTPNPSVFVSGGDEETVHAEKIKYDIIIRTRVRTITRITLI